MLKENNMSMGSSKQILCRLCLNIINDTDFEVIEEIIKGILQVVLPHLDLETRDKHLMCRTCHVNLISAYNFKSMCIDTEDVIISYISPEQMPVIKLKDVYLKEKGNIHLTDISDSQRICRLCMQLVTYGFLSLNEVELGIIVKYIPEVNINNTKDSVICGLCFDSLHTYDSFVKNCLEAQEQSYIKAEEIYIKAEECDQDNDSSFHDLFEGTIKNNERKRIPEDTFEIKVEASLDTPLPSKIQVNNCGANNYESKLHKDPSAIRMYQCDVCSYESKYKNSLTRHQLTHKDTSEIQMHMCNVCSYETKYRSNLKDHQLIHKHPLDVRMYTCSMCNYKTKHKQYLKRHKLKHKKSSKIQMHKCDVCGYNTRYKPYLKRHQLMHKNSSETQMYKCDACGFETKYKSYLKKHQTLHEGHSKIRIYKCDVCNFETRRKTDLKYHQLMPKDLSEIQMYVCNACGYETKYKNCLKRHQLTHEYAAE